MARRLPVSSWPPPPQDTPACALCERAAPHLTEHHLIPRSQGRRRGAKVSDLPTAMLCGPCHKFLHRTFSNAELAQDYSAVDALLEHEDVRRFVAWIKKQPASRSVRVR
ncbi:HNH endonuclease [Deinococcus radiopugnans]|uniref:5-methylcytosine-specific restriction endonuclease McrA n=1 Tax=Deinococcus radiopugnans ATCC 19172 TaxID=585398 RepID=A0A5C4XZD7_9DEIO|nr:HNH endonuclease [Deinococcus radiopugnans]MBB6017908.1 5-methylcytosine-specific restriction endonuclease McrA [Deinococcus radiopugnans ATCC 19172]TNM68967.1 HNH endonuclease [Deinococcus radiopugnans ATCC 19172]